MKKIAIIIGILGIILLIFNLYMIMPKQEKKISVLVATKDIKKGNMVNGTVVAEKKINSDIVPKDVLTLADIATTKYVRSDIYSGDYITKRKITEDLSEVRGKIIKPEEGKSAVAISVPKNNAIDVPIDDMVDIYTSGKINTKGGKLVSCSKILDVVHDKNMVLYTLEISPNDVEKIAKARNGEILTLAKIVSCNNVEEIQEQADNEEKKVLSDNEKNDKIKHDLSNPPLPSTTENLHQGKKFMEHVEKEISGKKKSNSVTTSQERGSYTIEIVAGSEVTRQYVGEK